jgi:hypothetical protein
MTIPALSASDNPSLSPFPGRIDVERLRRTCLDAGADDVGFVAIDGHELDGQRAEILGLYPWPKGLISLVFRMNRGPIRGPGRSVANLEFHHVGHHTDEVASKIVSALEAEGVRAVNPATGFPMESGGGCPARAGLAPDGPVAGMASGADRPPGTTPGADARAGRDRLER